MYLYIICVILRCLSVIGDTELNLFEDQRLFQEHVQSREKSATGEMRDCISKIKNMMNSIMVPDDYMPNVPILSTDKLIKFCDTLNVKYTKKKNKMLRDGSALQKGIIQFYNDALECSKDYALSVASIKKLNSQQQLELERDLHILKNRQKNQPPTMRLFPVRDDL